MDELKTHKIEDVKNRLYDVKDTITHRRHEGTLHPIDRRVSHEWNDQEKKYTPDEDNFKKPHMSVFKKFFILASIFFIGAIGYACFIYFTDRNVVVSSENIDMQITGSTFTEGGQELSLQLDVTNNNNANLEYVNLSIEYPKGNSEDVTEMVRIPREEIGVLIPGQHITRTFKVLLYGEEKSVKNVKATLDYHPAGSNAIFTKELNYPVTISLAPVSIKLDAPTEISADQDFTLVVDARLQTTLPPGGALLEIKYPTGFIFESAVPAPSFGNFVWNVDSMTKEKPFNLVIKGKLSGQDNDEKVFHATLGGAGNSSRVTLAYSSLLHTVKITKPFLETHVLVNGQELSEYVAPAYGDIDGKISWVNNLSTKITDAQISLNLSGSAYDRKTVNPSEGFYDSVNNRIIWDKNTLKDLASIEPGQKGEVSFKLAPLATTMTQNTVVNPQINLDVSLFGRQPISGSTFADVKNITRKVIKIASDFQIAAQANYLNGPLPPKSEQETKYKITWTLSNTTNKLTGATAVSVLPVYVKWSAGIAPITENVTYNEVTREVTWNIGDVQSFAGFKGTREVSFVVGLSPSLAQVGSVPLLMKEVSLYAKDSFTNSFVKSRYGTVNTVLVNDPKFKYGNERVVQ